MLKFLVVAVVLQLVQMAVVDGTTTESQLRAAMMENYDKTSRPSNPTTVNISKFHLLDLDMNEAEHMMNIHGWISYSWMDPRLAWNPEDAPGVAFVAMDPDMLWRPDLTSYNPGDVDHYMRQAKVLMLVYPNGKVLHVPPVQLKAICVMDLTYWPHDSHECLVKLGSWIYHSGLVDINLSSSDVLETQFRNYTKDSGKHITNLNWEIQGTKMERTAKIYACCVESYVSVQFYLQVRRNAPALAWTVKIPAVCLSILTLVLFLLPPNAGEKMTFGGLCLVLNVFFIAYISHIVAQAPTHTPLIVQLACHQLVLVVVVVVVVVAALVVRMARSPRSSPLPPILKWPALAASPFLCLSNYKDLASSSKEGQALVGKSEEVELGEGSKDRRVRGQSCHQNEWLLLAAVFDRLAFFLCLIICFGILIRFSSVL